MNNMRSTLTSEQTERLLRLEWIETLVDLFPDQARRAQQNLDAQLAGVTVTRQRCQIYRDNIAYWQSVIHEHTPNHERYQREM